MAKIIINRRSSIFNSMRSFEVCIDGKNAGFIKNGSSEEFVLPQGVHTIQCKVSFFSSNPQTVDLSENQVKVLAVSIRSQRYIFLYVLIGMVMLLPLFVQYPRPEWYKTFRIVFSVGILIYLSFLMIFLRKSHLKLEEDAKSFFNS